MSAEARTAYGLGFAGLDADPPLTGPPSVGAPTITITRGRRRGSPFAGRVVDTVRADLEFGSGVRVVLDRAGRTARYAGTPLPRDERAHPYLSPVAVIHNRWLGREVFHAGVFELGGRAWVVVGPREAGKSSLLAGVDARGCSVLADDIAVCSGPDVFSGPRCVDLRAAVPGTVRPPATARGGLRQRLHLPPAPFRVPLGGWIFLRWGAALDLCPVPPEALIALLARRRLHPALPSDPEVLLSLAAAPAWRLTRPRDWTQAGSVLSALLEATSAHRVVW